MTMSLHSTARLHTKCELEARGIPLHPHLPLRDERVTRAPRRVALQLVALYALAGLANGAEPKMLAEWLLEEGVWEFIPEAERRLFSSQAALGQALNELSWKQESLFLLCWAGKIVPSLPFPDKECDLGPVFSSIPPEVRCLDFIQSFALRNQDDVIAQLDLYYCLHAALRHPELWRGTRPGDTVAYPIVLERRRALEWLCCAETSWHDVALDT